MRILHTSDWHLGKKIFGVSLIDIQKDILNQLLNTLINKKVELLLISGDIFDRAIPPVEALILLNDFLLKIREIKGLNTVIISGNHDNRNRLGFLSDFLRSDNIFIRTSLVNSDKPLYFEDSNGKIAVYTFPFAEETEYRELLDLNNGSYGMSEWVFKIKEDMDKNIRNIAMGHTMLVGGIESDSERIINVGGEVGIDVSCFSGFNYVAMGHLHRRQKIKEECIMYSGSLYKYSFSEANNKKAFLFIEMDSKGIINKTEIKYNLIRDLKVIKGDFKEIENNAYNNPNQKDFIKVILTDKEPIIDPMLRLKVYYPNLLMIEREYLKNKDASIKSQKSIDKLSNKELIEQFYKTVYEDELNEKQKAFLYELLEKTGDAYNEN